MTLGCFIDSQFRHFLSGGWFWIGGTLIAASANAQMSVGAPIDQRMANQIVSGTTAALGSLNNQFGLASSPSGLPLPSPKEANIQRPLLGTATPSQPWQPLSRFTLDAITKHIEANSGSHVVLTYSDGTTEAVSSTPAGFSALQPSSTTSRSKLERSVRNPRGLTLRYGIQGEPSEIQADDLSGADSTDLPHRTRAERFLRTNGDLLQLRNPGNETKLSSESIDAGGTRRFRYKQMFQGVPVFGHDGSIYVNAYGAVKSFRGHFRPTVAGGMNP